MEIAKYEPGTPCWVELEVPDPQSAKRFYGQLFGWSFDDMPVPGDGTYTMARVRGKDVAALTGLTPRAKAAGAPPHWNSYLAVADVDATATRAAGLGGRVLAQPFDVLDAGRMAVIQDPTGAVFMLWRARRHPGAAVANENGAWSWNELYTNDIDRSRAFYTKLFGWTTREIKGLPGAVVFENRGHGMADLMPIKKEWGNVEPHWEVYFEVDDCDAAVARAKQLGATVFVEPVTVPGVGRFAGVSDPQGASFMVIKSETQA